MLSKEAGDFLVKLARKTIENFVHGKETCVPDEYPEELNDKRGVFCTLTKQGKLRGCIGIIEAENRLIENVINVAKSACQDSRFPHYLQEDELSDVIVEVSVLTTPKVCELSDIEKGDGVVFESGSFTSLFLPQVWEHFESKEEFLMALVEKSGLPGIAYKERDSKYKKFEVQFFEE